MNIQTLLYNENFYAKLALTLAIIRSTPSHFTPREYVKHLQIIFRQKKNNERVQFQQISSELQLLRQSRSISVPTHPLESHLNFLDNLLTKSLDMNIEIQPIILQTLDRIFHLMKINLLRINQPLFRQAITLILNYDFLPNIQKHSIEHIEHFLPLLLKIIKQQPDMTADVQVLIEQIGRHN